MSLSSYDKAVAGFEALISAPSNAAHSSPASLIKNSGQKLSTGYRHTAALEADGFLRRDANGSYLLGASGLRIGLRAFGLGHIAPVLPPLLLGLRQTTHHTAFLAMLDGEEVHMGPYSVGRACRKIKLTQRARFEAPRDLPLNRARDVALVPSNGKPTHRVHALMTSIAQTGAFTAVLGLVLNPALEQNPRLEVALTQAAGQITP